LTVFEAEAAGLEVGEYELDAPALGVVERGEIAWSLGMARIHSSSWPGSWVKPTIVRTRRCCTDPAIGGVSGPA